jgi:hypothetical protein
MWWGLSSNFIALLSGIIGTAFGLVGVFALYSSATDADQRIAETNERAAKLANKTEQLKAKNLEFESAISPRILEQTITAKKLEPFSDISFRVVSPSDFEPKRTAGQIRFMLRQAKWQKFSCTITMPLRFSEGVSVHGWVGPIHGVPDNASRQGAIRSGEAARALVAVLNEAGVESKIGFPIPELGPNAVLVEVGPKPLPAALELKPENIPADSSGNKTWGNIEAE